ncbi:MAG: MFS transporter [Candidatus Acidiferrales bacterium]
MFVELSSKTRVSAAARINRLPITSFHRKLTWLLGFIFFFDMADINTFSFAAPAILKVWHLSLSTIAVLTSATFVGMFVGSTMGGWFSDRVGRKRALIFTTLWYAVFSLLNASVWEPAGLFVTRMFTGIGISAMTVVGITYISELYPARLRGTYQGWIMAIGLCGVPMTAYVARFCVPVASWGWRVVFVWGSLAVIIPIFSGSLEESPRWYENHGRFSDAEAVLQRLEGTALSEGRSLPPVSEVASAASRRGTYLDLFRFPHATRTVMLVVVWICFTLGFYGFTAWVPTLLVAHGFSLVHSLTWSSAMSLATVPGAALAAVVSDRWDRKWLIVVVALLIAACGLTYGLSFQVSMIIIFGFLVEMFLHALSPLLYTYSAESFPTEIRNSGMGLTYGAGRLANVFGPLVVALLFTHYGYSSVFIYVALTWTLLALAIAGFGPRSKLLA